MQPARGDGITTLGNSPEKWIVVTCPKCGRRGEYKRETLLEQFDPNTRMPDFLQIFAAAKGCRLATPNPTSFELARARECLIRYDVE
jgi:hypothetical protein